MKKILRIDLNNRQYRFEKTTPVYTNLGGRGLTSKIVGEEVPPKADPLGPDNKLVFAPGILAGTAAPNNGRLSVGAKSPLTGGIKEANAGGAAARKIARLGIQGIVVEGISSSLIMVKVTKDGVEFIPADGFPGTGNYEIIERLRASCGEGISVISIGPCGERLVKAAGISVTSPDFKIRMAARGGLGAVMGSKNLKALIVDDTGTQDVEVADVALLKKSAAALTKGILSHPLIGGFRALGTPMLVNMINGSGCLPTQNYSLGQFEDAEKISGEYMAESQARRPNSRASHRCMQGCVVSCSNVYTDENGGEIVSGLEYETLGLVGSNCLIGDLDEIAVINRLCNDLGLDTMEVGTAMAVAMEAGLIPWGDGKAARALIEEAWKGTEKGLMIANGCLSTGRTLGVKRIPAVKGQSLAAYDPRVLKGTGVTYATSPMGADHTCGNALPSPANPDYNPAASTGQGVVSQSLQIFHAATDCLGLCLFAAIPLLDMPDLLKPLIACAAAVTGEMPDEGYLVNLGLSVLKAEKQFNELAGFTASEDRLPEFFTEEPLLPSGLVYDVPEAELDAALSF